MGSHPRLRLLWLMLVCIALSACSRSAPVLPRLSSGDIVLAFGDSLTFGTGAPRGESYPEVLSALIGHDVVSAGVPGERTADGLLRFADALETHRPRIVLLCMGGNDMLRQVDPGDIEANLRQMIDAARERGIGVLLIGVPKPALFGGNAGFYQRIAQDYDLPYEGEVLNDILRDNEYKSDLIHPNAKGYRIFAQALADLLRVSGAI
jgi:acyl-CoA thioesterase-1